MAAPKVYTRAEAMTVLRISKTKLYRLIKSGELYAKYAGRRVLIPETAIQEYLDSDRAPAKPAA